ncbi:MAG: hypothetical protein K6U00_09495 [Armatimonadetes bacterium]|nr:hypothetical protein [Armatimonadota bacterium]
MHKRSGPIGQVDPAREGLNWYVYVDGNPARFIDPSGLVLSEAQCAKIREVLEYEKDMEPYGQPVISLIHLVRPIGEQV